MNKYTSKKGFSLVEILVALSILAIVVGIAGQAYRLTLTDAKSTKAEIAIQRVAEAKTQYYLDNMKNPNLIDPPTLASLVPYLKTYGTGTNIFYNRPGSLFEGVYPAKETNWVIHPNAKGIKPIITNTPPP